MAEDEADPKQRHSHDASYNVPNKYQNPGELAVALPAQNFPTNHIPQARLSRDGQNCPSLVKLDSREAGHQDLVGSTSQGTPPSARISQSVRRQSREGSNYSVPDNYANLDELAASEPVENPDENAIYLHRSLEDTRNEEQEHERNEEKERRASIARGENLKEEEDKRRRELHQVSRFETQLYTISYLVLFSFFGTLARLGLQAITFYPGAPILFSVVWANFAGSLVMGFLSEDRMLFKQEWDSSAYDHQNQDARKQVQDEESCSACRHGSELKAANKLHAATKKTIPLYIGLATGFCGCFTSFSSFIRDAFLSMSNHLLASGSTTAPPRNGGYSFMALLAVILTTLAVCISALRIGAHLAIASEHFTPSLSFAFRRNVLDRVAVVLACGCWLGAILLAIFPPYNIWRGEAVFALVFAPLGCLARFYASTRLNGKLSSFPLGTFIVNIFGTVILGVAYDLQHVPLGGIIGCQVLQGIEDGFCGCLTTVSTWVVELSSLRRAHAYRYGAVSIVTALCFLIVIMGSMQWTLGFLSLQCVG